MMEILSCLIAFVFVTTALVSIFYMGSQSRTDSKLESVRELVAEIRDTSSYGDKTLILIAYSPLIFRTGFYGFMGIIAIAGYSAVGYVCGHNPWPFIKDIIIGTYDFIRGNDTAVIDNSLEINTPTN